MDEPVASEIIPGPCGNKGQHNRRYRKQTGVILLGFDDSNPYRRSSCRLVTFQPSL